MQFHGKLGLVLIPVSPCVSVPIMCQSHMSRKCKETLKRAYLGARGKMRDEQKSEESCSRMGSVSVMVINGEKVVIANLGDYRAVVCRDGIAYQKTARHHQSAKTHWTRRLFSGINTLFSPIYFPTLRFNLVQS